MLNDFLGDKRGISKQNHIFILFIENNEGIMNQNNIYTCFMY